MNPNVGVWIDHERAVIVSEVAGAISTVTVASDVGSHPHYAGQQDGGGEKKYEARHQQRLGRFYDDVVAGLGQPEALLIFGPGEAKRELEARLGRSQTPRSLPVDVEASDRLTEPQIVAKVREHFRVVR